MSSSSLLLAAFFILCTFTFLQHPAHAAIPGAYISQASKKPHTVPIKTPQQLQKALSQNKYILFFTVGEALKAQCPYCHVFKEEYEKIATQYWEKGKRDQVFFVVEYQQEMMSLIQGIGLRQVPALFNIETKAMCDIASKRLQECVREWTGVSVDVPSQMRMPQNAGGGGGAQSGGASAAYRSVQSIQTLLYLFVFVGLIIAGLMIRKVGLISVLLTVGGWAVFLGSLGGTVYNWINTPPPFQMGQDGNVAFFYPSHMQQLSLEGYISGAMMLLNAMCFLGISEFVPTLKSAFTRRIVSCVFIATWFGSGLMLVSFFLLKNNWYMSGTPFSPYLQILSALVRR